MTGDRHNPTERGGELTELRAQWQALVEAETLHMLPPPALIASIKDLAGELLVRTDLTPRSAGRGENKEQTR